MPFQAAENPRALCVRVSADAWGEARAPGVPVRFAGKIPVSWGAEEALHAFCKAVGEVVRDVGRGVDAPSSWRASRQFAAKSKGASLPSSVTMEVLMPRELEVALRDRLDERGWVQLPEPWGGMAAVFTGGPGEVRAAHLLGLPPSLELPFLQSLLEASNFNVRELTRLACPLAGEGFERGDVARLVVPASTKLPEEIQICADSTGEALAVLRVRPISSLPPAPGERGSYATAAAGAAVRPPPAGGPGGAAGSGQPVQRPGGGSGRPLSLGGQRGQQPGGSGGRPPAQGSQQGQQSGGSQRAQGSRGGAVSGAAGGGGGRGNRRSSRSPERGGASGELALQHEHPPSGQPGSDSKKQKVEGAAGAAAALPTHNRFSNLTDSDDMDAEAAALAATQQAGDDPAMSDAAQGDN